MSICICRYPLLIRDYRGSRTIDFISLPVEVFAGKEFILPRLERIALPDSNGDLVYHIAVHWKELNHDNVGEYDVNGHNVIAGCDPSEMSIEDGELVCNIKNIYIVYHPEDEWASYHVIELHDSSKLHNSDS